MNVAVRREYGVLLKIDTVEVMNAKIEPYEMLNYREKFEPKVFLQNTVLIASRRKKYNQQKWLN
jgi:hypothetical protein